MIFAGIDPGTARLGWAIIQKEKSSIRPIDFGCVETDKTLSPPDRLLIHFKELSKIFRKYKPACVSVEDLFFSKNVTTAISVAQARGIVLLVAAQQKIPVISYTPRVIKQTITGSGSADKKQIQKMVVRLLHLTNIPKLDDTADALAIALTHAFTLRLKKTS